MDNASLQKRIEALEKQFSLLKNSNTIPIEIERAFKGRGFLQSSNLMLSGYTTLNAFGEGRVPVSGASMNNIAVAVYADGTSPGVGSILVNGTSGIELYLNGTALADVFWIVFLTSNNTF